MPVTDLPRIAEAPWESVAPPLRRAGHFEGQAGSIALARDLASAFVRELSADWQVQVSPMAAGDLMLVVSELVTNVERHAPGPCLLELESDGGSVLVTVWDTSTDPPLRLPRDPQRIGGHGLEIVDRLSEVLTVEGVPVGKRIRARVSLG